MKIKTIIAVLLVLIGSKFANADDNEITGKEWQRQCIENNESLAKCCKDKKKECEENAEDEEAKKACTKKDKACRIKKVKITQNNVTK